MRPLIALMLLCAAGPLAAQVRPVPSGTDPLQQSVLYADDQTVILETAPGFQLAIEFEDGEKVASAAAGNTAAWQIAAPAGASTMFVRPQPGAPTTNLSVITSRRRYSFLLVAADKMTSAQPLTVRFTYPASVPVVPAAVAEPEPTKPAGSWRVTGDRLLRPSLIWDDGRRTYLDWPEELELPAVFAIDGRGAETLVNGYMRGNRFVIDTVFSRLVFRLDRQTARADRTTK